MANRLAGEKSPYLLQHADNPVDWYPWGAEALNRARQEDRPILVSIGYSACHWCHVMAHESFEDEATARIMNDLFVNIKVDREERPDVDAIYMEAVQALTGQGGWPLNVFLTPDGRPFYGGTYFPPQPRYRMPSWTDVVQNVATAYRDRREDVLQNASVLTQYIRDAQMRTSSGADVGPELLREAHANAASQFEWSQGGFGGGPKFPQPLSLEFLLRMYHRIGDDKTLEFVLTTLDHMAEGGIFDQLGGGFHRYTVDGAWVIPHFEKMLYDNALLARVYLQAYQLTRQDRYRAVVERTLDYLVRDMTSPEGGFYSAEDADSEGVEGKFYVWTPEELQAALGDEMAEIAALALGVRRGGNFEGKTILTQALPIAEVARRTGRATHDVERRLAEARARLFAARAERVPPGKDTKILAGWNGLAIRAFAEAGRVLGRDDYLAAAARAARFVLESLQVDGSLMRSYREGPSAIPGFLEDHAFLAEACLSLYETTFELIFFREAERLAGEMLARFRETGHDGFLDTQADTGELIVRPRSYFDNPIPSGNAAAAFVLLRLAALTGDGRYEEFAAGCFRPMQDVLARSPLGFPYLLCAVDFYLAGAAQIALVAGPPSSVADLADVVYDRFLPNKVVAAGKGNEPALLAGRQEVAGAPTAYVCKDFACRLPVTSPGELATQLDELATRSR